MRLHDLIETISPDEYDEVSIKFEDKNDRCKVLWEGKVEDFEEKKVLDFEVARIGMGDHELDVIVYDPYGLKGRRK